MRICQRSPPRARTGTDSLHNNRHLIGTRLIAVDMRGQRGPRNQKRRRSRDAAGCACPRADSKMTPAGKMAGGCRRSESAGQSHETRSGAARATPPYTLVPPGGFEPSTPALGGRVHSSQLGFSDFTWFYITACKTVFFTESMLMVRILIHPYFTPFIVAGVKSLRYAQGQGLRALALSVTQPITTRGTHGAQNQTERQRIR